MFVLLLATALQSSAGINASTFPTSILVECTKRDDLKLDGCVGYILGVADTLQIDGKTCHGQSDVWTRQTVAVVRKYIDDNPASWDKGAPFLVREALMKAFPCPWTKYQKR
jgi:hypothetical protein